MLIPQKHFENRPKRSKYLSQKITKLMQPTYSLRQIIFSFGAISRLHSNIEDLIAVIFVLFILILYFTSFNYILYNQMICDTPT